jgi:putative ABC transport system substrate-binding protein
VTRIARRTVLKASAAVAAPWLVRARAQTRARRIGVLLPWDDSMQVPPNVASEYWKGLGWIVGETLLIERRYAAWRMERLPELADELLREQHVDLLMTWGANAAAAAARATRTVPVVFSMAYAPVECGLIDSYARPGRNVTGIAGHSGAEFLAKVLEFIRAIAPSARRIAFCGSDTSQITLSGEPLPWSIIPAAAQALGFEITRHVARRTEDVERVLGDAAAERAQAALILAWPFVGERVRVVDFAMRQRWISATDIDLLFDAGLLLLHGPSQADLSYAWIRWGQMADRILRGANPAEIPVEIPNRSELALNLKVARALGLTLPQPLLLRADRVVE